MLDLKPIFIKIEKNMNEPFFENQIKESLLFGKKEVTFGIIGRVSEMEGVLDELYQRLDTKPSDEFRIYGIGDIYFIKKNSRNSF